MFYTKDWLPLKQVYFLASFAAAKKSKETEGKALTVSLDQPGPHTKQAIDLILSIKTVGVLLGNGQHVCASAELLRGIDVGFDVRMVDVGFKDPVVAKATPINQHVDLSVGTVGSGRRRYITGDDNQQDSLDSNLLYGPFLGCPIILHKAEVAAEIQDRFDCDLNQLIDSTRKITRATFEEQSQPVKLKGKGGRPGRGGGAIETVMKNLFDHEYPHGIPEGKGPESVVADFIRAAEILFKDKVPRSNMRRYLGLSKK